MHEQSVTEPGKGGLDDLSFNYSNVVWPRTLQGPFLGPQTASEAARYRSQETDPLHLHAPLSPLGNEQKATAPWWMTNPIMFNAIINYLQGLYR